MAAITFYDIQHELFQLESLTLTASVRVGSYFPVPFVGFSLRIGTMGLEGILGVIS